MIERLDIKYRYCIGISILFCAVGDLLISGFMVEDYYVMMLGLGLVGVGVVGIAVPSIPEIV